MHLNTKTMFLLQNNKLKKKQKKHAHDFSCNQCSHFGQDFEALSRQSLVEQLIKAPHRNIYSTTHMIKALRSMLLISKKF